MVEGFSGHLLEWLITGKIDVAVLYNAPRISNLSAEPLLQEEISLLGAVNDPAGLTADPVPASRLVELPMISAQPSARPEAGGRRAARRGGDRTEHRA